MSGITFGSAARAWRRARERTQAEVARAIGRSPSHICWIENGRVEPTAEDRRRIARFLRMPANEAR